MKKLLLCLCLPCLAPSWMLAQIFVKADAPSGGDGATWATAYHDLQDALDAAAAGDEIWVAAGTYLPTRDIDGGTDDPRTFTFFMNKDLTIFGGFPSTGDPTLAQRDWIAHPTMLSGDFNGDDGPDFANTGENAHHVVYAQHVSNAFLIDGFIIQGGNAGGDDITDVSGGGWYNHAVNDFASPTLRHCLFQYNQGGAMYNRAAIFDKSIPPGGTGPKGGNISDDTPGSSSPILSDCVFQYNLAGRGGAVHHRLGSQGTGSLSLTNCIFRYNQAEDGGAIFNENDGGTSTLSLTNCIFLGNQAQLEGGSIGLQNNENGAGSAVITNCTFRDNQAPSGGALYASLTNNFTNGMDQGLSADINNCIFWNNDTDGPSFFNQNAELNISYSLLEESDCPPDLVCGMGMVYGQDPLFVAEDDVHLQPCSPAIDAGTAEGAPNSDVDGDVRPQSAGIDLGADEHAGPGPAPVALCRDVTIITDADGTASLDIPLLNDGSTGCSALTFTVDGQSSLTFGCQDFGDGEPVTLDLTLTVTDEQGLTANCVATVTVAGSVGPIIYVNAAAEAGGNGGSWSTAFRTLQEAITLARSCHRYTHIWVAEGTYVPRVASYGAAVDPRDVTFYFDRDLQVYGGFPAVGKPGMEQRNRQAYPTVLSGDIIGDDQAGFVNTGDNAYSVVTTAKVSDNFLLDGFIIRGGSATAQTGSQLNDPRRGGGGLYNVGVKDRPSSPRVQNCRFERNRAVNGGALFNEAYIGTSNPVLFNCIFENNLADQLGGALFNYAEQGNCSTTLTNCLFWNNQANGNGGAIVNWSVTTSTMSSNLTNCTLVKNGAVGGDRVVNSDDGSGSNVSTITNSIIWEIHGEGRSVGNSNAGAQISYSLLLDNACPPGAVCGEGMIYDRNPFFLDAEGGDLHLHRYSPAINRGTADGAPDVDLAGGERPQGQGYDMGVYEVEGFVCPATPRLYVSASGLSGMVDGASWAGAFSDLQMALDVARGCNIPEIWVAEGTYLPSRAVDGSTDEQRVFTFLIDFDVRIYGGFPASGDPGMDQRDWINHPTILSGDFNGDDEPDFVNRLDNAYNVVYTRELSPAFVMDGFIIQGGNANTMRGADHHGRGGGWYNDGTGSGNASSPTIQNSVFRHNFAILGGALANIGDEGESSPAIYNCLFQANQAEQGDAVFNSSEHGVAMPTIANCTFRANSGTSNVILNYGLDGTNAPHIFNCIFWDNPGGGSIAVVDHTAAPQLSYSLLQESACPAGVTCGAGMVYAQDPLFVELDDVHLLPTSPAVDAGTADGAPAFDFAGDVRPQGYGYDMGIYEQAGNSCPMSDRLYVNAAATTGGNGASWSTAFTHLQPALDAARQCGITEIWVAEGTYLPTQTPDGAGDNQRDYTFYIDFDVQLYGGFPATGDPTLAQRDWENYTTTLSGDLNGDDGPDFQNMEENVYTVVYTTNVSSAFHMDGFTIRGGNSNSSPPQGALPNLVNQNSREGGGAWYNESSGLDVPADPTIENCRFLNNYAISGGAMVNLSFDFGGFLQAGGKASAKTGNQSVNSSSPTLINCVFQNNRAEEGGAMFNAGLSGASSPVLKHCSFVDNRADNDGGAMFNFSNGGGASPSLFNCIFRANAAEDVGGALVNFSSGGKSSPELINCDLVYNQANEAGAIYNHVKVPQEEEFKGASLAKVSPEIINCILWGNGGNGPSLVNENATTYLSHSLLQEDSCPENAECNGEMIYNEDPLLVDAASGDLHLLEQSPAIDRGTIFGAPATDFEGDPRPFGNGVDMGVDESPYIRQLCAPPVAVCRSVTVQLHENGQAGISASDIDDGSTADCGLQSLAVFPFQFDCSQIYAEQTVTLTVTDLEGNVAACTAGIRVVGLPCGFSDPGGIGCSSTAGFDAASRTFTLQTDGCGGGSPYSDQQGFIAYELCGNGSISFRVASLSSTNAFAGIVLRTGFAPGAVKAEVVTNRYFTARGAVREQPNAAAWPTSFFLSGRHWLQLRRIGNQVQVYSSTDGQNWTILLVRTLAMPACVQLGMVAYGPGTVTATFDDVKVNGAPLPIGGGGFPFPTSDFPLPTPSTVHRLPSTGLEAPLPSPRRGETGPLQTSPEGGGSPIEADFPFPTSDFPLPTSTSSTVHRLPSTVLEAPLPSPRRGETGPLQTSPERGGFPLLETSSPPSTVYRLPFTVYPNPSSGWVTVDLPAGLALEGAVLDLLDQFGRRLWRKRVGSERRHQLDLSGLAPGVYFVRLSSAQSERWVERLILQP